MLLDSEAFTAGFSGFIQYGMIGRFDPSTFSAAEAEELFEHSIEGYNPYEHGHYYDDCSWVGGVGIGFEGAEIVDVRLDSRALRSSIVREAGWFEALLGVTLAEVRVTMLGLEIEVWNVRRAEGDKEPFGLATAKAYLMFENAGRLSFMGWWKEGVRQHLEGRYILYP